MILDFMFGLPKYVPYNKEFVISRFCSIPFSVTLAGLIMKNIVHFNIKD